MSKISDFYIGVLDFFAVILPGAIATYLLEPRIGNAIVGPIVSEPSSEAAKWALFLVSSYFVGHLVYLVASNVDELFFHEWRVRWRPRSAGTPYALAAAICEGLIGPETGRKLNNFQLTRSILIAKCPAAAADVHRIEADSKFFRSLIVVAVAAAMAFLLARQIPVGLAAALVAVLCALRYGERRLKSEAQAYMHLVALHKVGALSNQASPDHTRDQEE